MCTRTDTVYQNMITRTSSVLLQSSFRSSVILQNLIPYVQSLLPLRWLFIRTWWSIRTWLIRWWFFQMMNSSRWWFSPDDDFLISELDFQNFILILHLLRYVAFITSLVRSWHCRSEHHNIQNFCTIRTCCNFLPYKFSTWNLHIQIWKYTH